MQHEPAWCGDSGMTHAADVHIGTSGWHYRHWVGPFYPHGMRPKDFLGHYAGQFRTVELNATFYRLPSRQAVAAWRDGSPPGFVFAAKGSRFITHMKKLKDPETSISRYFDLIELLGDKLGPIVFQLPPRWHVDLERLSTFLKALRIRFVRLATAGTVISATSNPTKSISKST